MKGLLIATAILLGTGLSSKAQETPYSRVSLSAGPVYVMGDELLGGPWRAAPGAEFHAVTPFHVGGLSASLRYNRFEGSNGVPDFRALTVLAGWENGVALTPGLTLKAGFRMGSTRMQFDDPDARPGIRSESEFTASLVLSTRIRLSRGWFVRLSGSAERTFTRPEFDTRTFSGSVGRTFELPAWLEDFLR